MFVIYIVRYISYKGLHICILRDEIRILIMLEGFFPGFFSLLQASGHDNMFSGIVDGIPYWYRPKAKFPLIDQEEPSNSSTDSNKSV